MEKRVISIALIIALVAVIAAGSFAYFTDTTKSIDNTFTVGNVKITLTEPNWEGSGSKDAPEVYAGEPLAKDPTVTNTGANPCFVRVSVTGLNQFGDNAPIVYRNDKYEVGKLNDGWVLHTDGYYYYTKPLAVDEATPAVFSSIVMPTTLTGNETNIEPITVQAFAVQAQGARPSWTAVNGMTVAEIAAWFTTCGM